MFIKKIEKCPFCGFDVQIKPTTLSYWNYRIIHQPLNGDNCIIGKDICIHAENLNAAIKKWNMRCKNE